LKKISPGLYLCPKESKWGETPVDDQALIKSFLKDDRFLMLSFNSYNGLGLGTTQLYNHTIVYNHKRHGEFKLGKRTYDFRMRTTFPENFTKEDLLVDMLNNISELAEDESMIISALYRNISNFKRQALENSAMLYEKIKTKKTIKKIYAENVST